MTGIDTYAAMLAQARARAAAAGAELDLREGGVRDLVLNEPAALIWIPFRALQHLPSRADRRRTFERVTASLNSARAVRLSPRRAILSAACADDQPSPASVRTGSESAGCRVA